MVWYAVPAGSFSPMDVAQERCAPSALSVNAAPPVPAWAKPNGPTHAIFVDTSLQEAYSVAGMQTMESLAAPHHVPVSWLIGNGLYLGNASLYNAYHANNGDDVEAEPDAQLISSMKGVFAWYVPTVSAEAAGRERHPLQALQQWGEFGFWGIAWNSHGIDATADAGAPWGAYCADPSSYKRPAPDGSCSLVSLEWTARDLTRAYLSGHEEFFSTDPDDPQLRGGFTPEAGASYVRAITDAYAAAGQTQPLVMVAQEETAESVAPGNSTILDALYSQAVSDGMSLQTIAQAAGNARAFAGAPRAIAFPFIAGGAQVGSPLLGNGTLYPATIDYHDTKSGMTFLAGHLTPSRIYRYADDPTSAYNVALFPLASTQLPTVTNVAIGNGTVALQINAPAALHYGVALWSDPAALRISGPHAVAAGRGGVVLTFDVQPGVNTVSVPCSGCTSAVLPYAT
jgi:hypothetical protein